MILYFPISPPNQCFCTTWENRKSKIASFHLNAECISLPKVTQNTFILSLVTAEPPFIRTRIDHMHQTKLSKRVYSTLLCLLPQNHLLPSLSWCRSLCQKWELFFVECEVKSQWTVLWDKLLSQQMLAVAKNVVDDNILIIILLFSNTARACICSLLPVLTNKMT